MHARQTALERQDLSRTYLAHHELENVVVVIIIIVVIMVVNVKFARCGAVHGDISVHPRRDQLRSFLCGWILHLKPPGEATATF